MKKCTMCKEKKLLNEFNFRIKALGLRQYQCKKCTRALVKNHYKINREYYLRKAKKRNAKNRLETQNYVRNYLSKHPCVDCEESDIIVLEFDHVRHKGNKFQAVSQLMRGRYSLQKVKEEIKKCEIRCANCHRRKTAKEFKWFKNKNAPVVKRISQRSSESLLRVQILPGVHNKKLKIKITRP